MKRMIMALAIGALAAGPAIAQPAPRMAWDAGAFWRGAPESPRERIEFLQSRIDHGLADGSLDRREGARASRELQGVRDWIRQMHYEDGGKLRRGQRDEVQARLDNVSRQINWMRRDGW